MAENTAGTVLRGVGYAVAATVLLAAVLASCSRGPCNYESGVEIKASALRQAHMLGYEVAGVLADTPDDQPPAVSGGRSCTTPVLRLTMRARPDNGHVYETRVSLEDGAFRLGDIRDLAAPTRPYEYHGK